MNVAVSGYFPNFFPLPAFDSFPFISIPLKVPVPLSNFQLPQLSWCVLLLLYLRQAVSILKRCLLSRIFFSSTFSPLVIPSIFLATRDAQPKSVSLSRIILLNPSLSVRPFLSLFLPLPTCFLLKFDVCPSSTELFTFSFLILAVLRDLFPDLR